MGDATRRGSRGHERERAAAVLRDNARRIYRFDDLASEAPTSISNGVDGPPAIPRRSAWRLAKGPSLRALRYAFLLFQRFFISLFNLGLLFFLSLFSERCAAPRLQQADGVNLGKK